jgi:DNA polymerase I-like protein with 3'-5' exonuclease and polymerase domains
MMVVAQPGNVLVGADMDQLELRIAAARWGAEMYLRAFIEGKDPHSMTAYSVFGAKYCEAAGIEESQFSRAGMLEGSAFDKGKFIGKGNAKAMRDLSKAVQYASQYMATVETVHKLIQKTEISAIDKQTGKKLGAGITDLPYAKLPLRKVRKMRNNWLKGAPQFERGWEVEIEAYRAKGYIKEPVHGRRRDFLDGESPNEIVNFPIQGSAAGLMNNAIVQLHEAIPLHKWGPGTGIINQCHDSIVVECPESEAHRVAGLMEECLNQTHPDLPGVTFTASADIGKTWKEVG